MFCREWLAQLELYKEEIKEAGLKVVAVALGKPQHAQRFCDKGAPSVTCYCDHKAKVYARYGLQQASAFQLLNPFVYTATARAAAKGHYQGTPTGDIKMLPGTFIVDTDGIIQYVYYSSHIGDHPDIDELIAVV